MNRPSRLARWAVTSICDQAVAGGDRLADIHRQRADGRAAIAQEVH